MALQDPQALILAAVATLVVITLVQWQINPLKSIPTVGGSSAPGLSILTARNFIRHGKRLLDEGYQKYYGSSFKVALADQWLVVVSGPQLVDELVRRPDSELSAPEGMAELAQMRHTAGNEVFDDPYQVGIIKEKLTRTLPVIFSDVAEEVKLALLDHIPTNGDGWTAVNVLKTTQKVVSRASNRVFVGLPLCRNEDYLAVCLRMALDFAQDSITVRPYPSFLKPLVAHFLGKANTSVGRCMAYIQPLINERKATMMELGDDWLNKPNDMLQWIMEEALRRNLKRTDHDIVKRILLVNTAALLSSSDTVTHALYDVASMPESIPELREEIESIIATDGWTKAAMAKMWKLDSVIKETLRYHNVPSIITLVRKAMQDVTLIDGTFIPKGTLLGAAMNPAHRDEEKYADPDVLDPFRFAKMRNGPGSDDARHQLVSTSLDYVPFGHGRHACPGRFFAANEIKVILAYILLNYDLRIGGDGKRPANLVRGTSVFAPVSPPVLFRERQAAPEA